MFEKFAAVYKITNTVTGDCYVGSSVHYKRRTREHIVDLRRGVSYCRYLQNAWNKYGESAFRWDVLELVGDVSVLIAREQYYLDLIRPTYNLRKAYVGNYQANPKAEQIARTIAHTSKPVVQYDMNWTQIAEYPSVAEAARQLNLSAGNIGSCCNGHFKTTGGFYFQFKNNPKPYVYKRHNRNRRRKVHGN